jgi:hypothetical protein
VAVKLHSLVGAELLSKNTAKLIKEMDRNYGKIMASSVPITRVYPKVSGLNRYRNKQQQQ